MFGKTYTIVYKIIMLIKLGTELRKARNQIGGIAQGDCGFRQYFNCVPPEARTWRSQLTIATRATPVSLQFGPSIPGLDGARRVSR